MAQKNKISIIIPCYNSEDTITRTLNSLNQNLIRDHCEIIIINDGSKDKTLNKAEVFFKNKQFDFKIINQTNRGLSSARNKGLEFSRGDYIWFVDSDDSIISKNIQLLFNILKNNYDIISFQILKSNSKKTYLNNFFNGTKRLVGVPYYIFKRKFLIQNKLSFIPNLIHEDLEFLPRVWEAYDSHFHLNAPLYNHIITENSITTSEVKLNRVISLLKIAVLHAKKINNKSSIYSFYSLVALNSAFRNSFKLNRDDFKSFKIYLKQNIFTLNKLFKVRHIGFIKYKSIISLTYFNILIKF